MVISITREYYFAKTTSLINGLITKGSTDRQRLC